MMVYLPAVFFGILFAVSFLKNGWNVGALLYLIFFITGIASIMLDANNLYNYNCLNRPLGVAPIFYCFFLWLCIWPFAWFLRRVEIKEVTLRNEKLIDLVTIAFFLMFVLDLYAAATNLGQVLANNTFSQLRQSKYSDEAVYFYSHLSGIPRYLCAISTFFMESSFIMLVIFFVNVLFRNTKWYYNAMALLASTSQLIGSVYSADRSQFVYWMVMFVLLYTFFYRSIKGKSRRKLFIYILPLLVIGAGYLVMVTVSRWGDTADGTEGGMILYAGQNFFNFCNYFNYFWDTPHSLCELFPLSYYLGGMDYWTWADIVESQTHIFIKNFSTFLGYICSISGPIVMILYAFFFCRISCTFLRFKNKVVVSFWEITKFWIVALVPACGFFCYHYSFYTTTIALILWLIIGKLSNKSIILCKRT